MSMRVERSSLDAVKKRFEMNKKKMEEKKKDYDFEERMKELREEVGEQSITVKLAFCLLNLTLDWKKKRKSPFSSSARHIHDHPFYQI